MTALFLFFFADNASALDPDKFLSQYVHDSWQVEDGLPSNFIPAVMQSKTGYLWLGTWQGLVRFDGVRFTVFDRNNAPAMRSHQILSVGEDKTGALLWGTLAGGLFAMSDGKVQKIQLPGALRGEPSISKVMYSSNGDLWLGANSGIYRQSGKTLSVVFAKEAPTGFRYTIAEDVRKTIWLGTAEGLMKFEGGNLISVGDYMPALRTAITALCPAPDGSIWVGTNAGLLRLNGQSLITITTQNGLQDNAITSLARDRDGNIWVGTHTGLSRLSGGAIQPLPKELIPNDEISSLTEDREGSLWIGTFANGLHRLRDGAFTTISAKEGLADDYARSIVEVADGSLLIATANGLNLMKGMSFGQIPLPANTQINALWKARDGSVWLGGNYLAEVSSGAIVPVQLPGQQPDETIHCITDDASGNIWVGTSKALYRLNKGQVARFSPANGLLSGQITNVLAAKNGDIYAVSFRAGLNLIRGGTCTRIDVKQGLTSIDIFDLHEDADGAVWITTAGDGLYRLKNGQCKRLTWDNGLYDNTVYRILEDRRANFWMSSPKAVFRVAKSELDGVLDGSRGRVRSVEYSVRDGMKSGECNSGFSPAGWLTSNGLMYFPTVRGVVRVDPSKFPVNTLEPPVVIESVGIDSIDAIPNGILTIPAGAKKLEIHYTGLSLFKPENVVFRYKLDGYDSRWVEIGSKREAGFTNLPPGEYTFTVTACNNDGVWNPVGAKISFVVEPFFYQTWWFRALLALAGLAAVYGVFSLRLRQLKQREITLQKIVDERTKDLSAANTSLHEANTALAGKIREVEELNVNLVALNDEKTTFLGIAAHDLKNPLAGIILTVQNISNYIAMLPQQKILDYMVKIELSAQRMRDIILYLLDINAIESGKLTIVPEDLVAAVFIRKIADDYTEKATAKNIAIQTEMPPDSLLVRADKNCLHAILDNLVSNAIKFSPSGRTVRISCAVIGKRVRIAVTDQGPGLTEEDKKKVFGKFAKLSARPTGGEHSSGLGLSIVKKMAEAMNGTVGCESEAGKGATFYVEAPKA